MPMGPDDSNKTRSMDRRQFLVLASSAAAAGASALAVPRAGAQTGDYPNHPVTLIIPQPPGSAIDLMGRIIASQLSVHLGQKVVVENKPGAGGSIATAAVAHAKKDGYTLCLGSSATMAVNAALYRSLPYDPVNDFAPVIKTGSTPNILVVPGQSPITSVEELIQRMKEKKKVFQYSSSGNGTALHLNGALFANLVGVKADHVPYRGAAEGATALIAAQVDFGFQSLPAAVNYVKDGRLRALAITSTKPAAALPNVPSFSAVGLGVLDKTSVWFGVVAPNGTPDAVLRTLHGAFVKTLNNPSVQSKLAAAGFDAEPPAPASEFAQFIRDQVPFWAGLVKISGALVE